MVNLQLHGKYTTTRGFAASPALRRPHLAACHYRVEGIPGTVGRIACRRRDFLYLQGYDEEDSRTELAALSWLLAGNVLNMLIDLDDFFYVSR